jgi:hypothetical protein
MEHGFVLEDVPEGDPHEAARQAQLVGVEE